MIDIDYDGIRKAARKLVFSRCSIERNACNGDEDRSPVTLEKARQIADDIYDMIAYGWTAEDVRKGK